MTRQNAQATQHRQKLGHSLMSSLSKCLRSAQLYQSQGPQFQAHLKDLVQSGAAATQNEAMALHLSPFRPYLEGEDIPEGQSEGRYWFQLFEEGVRQIRFLPGVDQEDWIGLLAVLSGVERAPTNGNDSTHLATSDLVTSLWRKDLPHVEVVVARTLVRHVGATSDNDDTTTQLERWKNQISPREWDPERKEEVHLKPILPDDFRMLVSDGQAFEWARIAREPSKEEAKEGHRPRLSAAIDEQLSDYERLLDVIEATGENSADLLINVIGSMLRFGQETELAKVLGVLGAHPGDTARAVQARIQESESLEHLLPLFEGAESIFTKGAEIQHAPLPVRTDSEPEQNTEDPGPTQSEKAQIEDLRRSLKDENPRVACGAVNSLLAVGNTEAFLVMFGAYGVRSDSVRQLVMIHAIKLARESTDRVVLAEARSLMLRGLEDSLRPIRQSIMKSLAQHTEPATAEALAEQLANGLGSSLPLEERLALLNIVAAHESLPNVCRSLCSLLLKVRLFGSDEELHYQTQVCSVLLQSRHPKAKQAIEKVLRSWTVPATVKNMIRDERDRIKNGAT